MLTTKAVASNEQCVCSQNPQPVYWPTVALSMHADGVTGIVESQHAGRRYWCIIRAGTYSAGLPTAPEGCKGLVKPGPQHHKLCVTCLGMRDVHLRQARRFSHISGMASQ